MGLVITREEALMPEHSPVCILHREAELKAINEAIKPLFEGRHPDNLFISGSPGTGKTACIKHVLKGLEGRSSRVKPIYVNCWQHSTRMAIYSLIARALDEMMPRRGLARDEVYDRIVEMMEKEGTRVLLVLDDIEGLFTHNEGKLLYELGRVGNGKPFFGIICISGNARAGREIEKSAMRFVDMEFEHYSGSQIAEILAQRAELGLSAGSWNKEVIGACATRVGKSNVRLGLELLWAAAKRAEKENRAKITPADMKAADACSLRKPDIANDFQMPSVSLSDEERLIIDIVKTGPKSSTDLYFAFLKKLKRSKRQIRNYLNGLEAKRLLFIRTVDGTSPLLNTRMIQLDFEMEGARELRF